jgi:hypothetical protein
MTKLKILHAMALRLWHSFNSVVVYPYGAPKYRQYLKASGHIRMAHKTPCQHLQTTETKGVWVAFKSDGDTLYMGCGSKSNPAIEYDEVVHCTNIACEKVFSFKRGNKVWNFASMEGTAHA